MSPGALNCLLMVLFEIHAEETHLRGASLLEVPSMLVVRAPTPPSAAPTLSRSSAPSLTGGGLGRARVGVHPTLI